MFHVALYNPQIPQNTGNIIRLCANSNCLLHLIEPLAFSLENKNLKRAGLDYHDLTTTTVHKNYESFLEHMGDNRIFAVSTKGKKIYSDVKYQKNDVFLFGSETRGLPQEIHDIFDNLKENRKIKIPMKENSRSLNLSNSAAVVIYEGLRQLNFKL
eukprot:TRINITY_DN16091_c0_g1_i1.p1 TRINITY_DN16091_c0_g1~~TRINITY_DN16091_c0_g1_i1.p1  ORF type:complete len:156 (+),score=23.49 TRINITY_DN16091_c0_g1_i1:81-548(+)